MQSTDLTAHLNPLSDLLAAFNHRHKNQHRRSAWWSHFNLLRRAVRRLVLTSSGPEAKSKPVAPDCIARQARWAVEHVVPSSYVAFTQLAADNQFAPLGLLLLGALARFNAAISPLLPTQNRYPATEDRSRVVSAKPSIPTSASALDLGESVSREAFSTPAAPQRDAKKPISQELVRTTSTPAKPAPTSDAVSERNKDKVKKKKKKKEAAAGTDLSDLFGSLA